MPEALGAIATLAQAMLYGRQFADSTRWANMVFYLVRRFG